MYKSIFILLLSIFSQLVFAGSISDLANKPSENRQILTEENYVSFRVLQLPNGVPIYINKSFLQSYGVDLDNLSEDELNRQIVDAFAWVSDQVSFTGSKSAPSKTMHSDYYGGEGLGPNHGSARAGILGQVQIKGVGVTPHYVGEVTSSHDGAAGFHEAIKEVVWGNLLENELPYGANRVISLIDTGLTKSDGEKHILIIREDPLRAGHFIRRTWKSDTQDLNRVQKNLANIDQAISNRDPKEAYLLKLCEHNKPESVIANSKDALDTKVKQRLLTADEWLYRLSKQIARFHARRYFHGATSESNININGQFIDYGTATANSGYGKIHFLEHVEPFGEFAEIDRRWGPGLTHKLFLDLDEELPNELYLNSKLKTTWKHYFKSAMSEEFSMLVGIPEKIVGRLKGDPRLNELGLRLYNISLKSSFRQSSVDIQNLDMPSNTGRINVQDLFVALSKTILNQKPIDDFLSSQTLISEIEGKELKLLWETVIALVRNEYKGMVGSDANFEELIKSNAKWLNRNQEDLYRDRFRTFTTELAKMYETGGLDMSIQKKVENLITKNIKVVHGLNVNEVPTAISYYEGKVKIEIFNATDGTTESRVGSFSGAQLKVLAVNSNTSCIDSAAKILRAEYIYGGMCSSATGYF